MRHDSAHPVFELPPLESLDLLDGPVLCPSCGPVTSLTSGWVPEGVVPSILFCCFCGAAVAAL
jgi:hypothetical protein